MTKENQISLPMAQLWSDDLKNLASSLITSELVAPTLLRRVGSDEGARVVGRRDKLGNYAGMLFSYGWPGERMSRDCRLRLDHPNPDYDAGGKPRQGTDEPTLARD